MPQLRNVAVLALLTLLVASTASAALSPQYTEWRNGPVQWIMTGAEKSAWKKVSSDEAASNFIDLFWARRDPTPGTPQNEARDEHDARVKHADETFAERGKRGSLTDRGRVWTVLGPPPNLNLFQGRITSTTDSHTAAAASAAASGRTQGGEGPTGRIDPSGGRQLGARDAWIWEHADASSRFGLPRVEIVFVTDPGTGKTIRDLFRRDFSAAEQAVLKKQIQEDYQTLPEWAAIGGLVPRTRVSLSGPPPVAAPRTPAPAKPAAPATAAPVAVATVPRGATRLTLTRNVFEIDPQSGSDPFAKLQAADRFKSTEELGWAAQYCGQSDQELSVPFMIRVAGGPAASPVDSATPLESVVPDRIKSSPGCHMLRGAIPLNDMPAGRYTLHLMVDDPIVKTDSYDLKHDFTIE